MREILFKAKRIDNGEWVEGNYLYCKKATTVSFRNEHYILVFDGYGVAYHEIDKETLCQYTGLTDKNGRKIWENDIMVAHLDDEFPEDVTYTRILWNNNGFCINENHSKCFCPLDKFVQIHYEVCGNIFDNPELLEVGDGD